MREEEVVCVEWALCCVLGLVWGCSAATCPTMPQQGPWVGLAHHSCLTATAKGKPVEQVCGYTPVACLTFGHKLILSPK